MRIWLMPGAQIGGRQPANAMAVRIRQHGGWPALGETARRAQVIRESDDKQ